MRKIIAFLIPCVPVLVSAQYLIENPLRFTDLIALVGGFVDIIIQVAMPFLVIMFVYVGFLFVSSKGDPKGLDNAKKAFKSTVIGSAVVLGAFVIAKAVESTIALLK